MAFALDLNLVHRALQGNGSDMEALVQALRPQVERQLMRYPVSDEDRQDLLQSTLMQVVRRLHSFRGESSFSTWLFRVTANEALMMMRSQRRMRARISGGLDLEDLGSLPSAASADSDAVTMDRESENQQRDSSVRRALAELPDDYRNVVVAHYHLDLSLQEIADRYEMTESAVRSRLHRARLRLRSILEGTAVGDDAREEAAWTSVRNVARSPRSLVATGSVGAAA